MWCILGYLYVNDWVSLDIRFKCENSKSLYIKLKVILTKHTSIYALSSDTFLLQDNNKCVSDWIATKRLDRFYKHVLKRKMSFEFLNGQNGFNRFKMESI